MITIMLYVLITDPICGNWEDGISCNDNYGCSQCIGYIYIQAYPRIKSVTALFYPF